MVLQSIQINDKYDTRLPMMTSEQTFVYQEGSTVYIKSMSGFSIECNFHFDICTLQLSGIHNSLKVFTRFKYHLNAGWYYGQTGGLFGTMDNEPATDLMSTNGTILSSVPDFASTWQLDTAQCPNYQVAQMATKIPDAKIISKCDAIFNFRESVMMDCFAVVRKSNFMFTFYSPLETYKSKQSKF